MTYSGRTLPLTVVCFALAINWPLAYAASDVESIYNSKSESHPMKEGEWWAIRFEGIFTFPELSKRPPIW